MTDSGPYRVQVDDLEQNTEGNPRAYLDFIGEQALTIQASEIARAMMTLPAPA